MVTANDVEEALHGVEDPELGMDIVEIGLFYEAQIDGGNVKVIHSLTSMGCPAGPMIQEGIHDAVAALPGVEKVEVEPGVKRQQGDQSAAGRLFQGDAGLEPYQLAVAMGRTRPLYAFLIMVDALGNQGVALAPLSPTNTG